MLPGPADAALAIWFRHMMTTLMPEGGADIRFIQAMLGQADLKKLRGYDFHFRFGTSVHAIAQGAMDLPESLTWLWRGYDPSKTAETFEMEEAERAKPLFRVRVSNREAW